jgi:hypothetical protein
VGWLAPCVLTILVAFSDGLGGCLFLPGAARLPPSRAGRGRVRTQTRSHARNHTRSLIQLQTMHTNTHTDARLRNPARHLRAAARATARSRRTWDGSPSTPSGCAASADAAAADAAVAVGTAPVPPPLNRARMAPTQYVLLEGGFAGAPASASLPLPPESRAPPQSIGFASGAQTLNARILNPKHTYRACGPTSMSRGRTPGSAGTSKSTGASEGFRIWKP